MSEPVATHAAIFKVEGKDYYVMASREGDGIVRGFENMRKGLDFFEIAYNEAHRRGYGWAAGAMINWMKLRPRVFHFGTRDELAKLLGEIVYPVTLSTNGVYEIAFRIPDQEAAAKLYEAACEPRLVSA